MKVFQPMLLCMKDKKITLETISAYPNNIYPNSYDYGYHDFFEMEFFLSGKGVHYINGIAYDVKPGYFYLLFPGDMHRMQLDPDVKFEMWNLKFDINIPKKELIKEIEEISKSACVYADQHTSTLQNELLLLNDCVNNNFWNEKIANNIIDRILNITLFLLQSNLKVERSFKDESYNKTIDYINKNYAKEITLSDLADFVGISKNYIGIYFKRNTGMCFSEFLLKTRLQRALHLLKHSNYSIKEITFKVGFHSPEYFCCCFKNTFGCSPTQFRKNNV